MIKKDQEQRIASLAAYEVIAHRALPDVDSDSWLLRHKKTGARIALLPKDDSNKVFYIAFRTPPEDSTGVAHIIEHTVLCGSREFPVKDPFIELAKGSLNTFLNAMTYPDKTMFPVASCNDQDFRNLMDVYLDAVFYPNIYRNEKIFRQEGWSWQLEEKDDPIVINGVVYNEMKGAFSSPDDVLERQIMNSLFPDTTYGVESGGDPEQIPQLSYEEFLDFHRKYYNPSNAYLYLYGKMDFAERLDYLDKAYLSAFDQAKDMGISVVPMPFIIGEETYYEEISLSRKEFFQRMEEGQKIVTSQPAPGEVMKIWDKALEKYDQVVYIPMSSGLSGSCQTAIMLADDYDGKVEVVNNQRISVTMKASVEDAIAMAEKGMDAAAIRERLEAVRFDSSIYIMLDTLEYLKRGGRITPAAAAIGTLLRLKPVLQIKGERLDAFSKARALNQGKMTMINAMKKDISELYGGVETETCKLYAVHASCPEPFRVWADEVAKAFPAFHVQEDELSLSVCTHIGPDALAIACSKKMEI